MQDAKQKLTQEFAYGGQELKLPFMAISRKDNQYRYVKVLQLRYRDFMFFITFVTTT